jgi:hypothetical protein
MKSNSHQSQTLREQMTDYISVSENIEGLSITQQWKYLPAAAAAGGGSSAAADPRDIIAQYYALEGQHCPTKTAARLNFKHFETALPRHYAIVAASRQPRQFSSLTHLQTSSLRVSATATQSNSRARARVHTLSDITPFTELTVRQKGFVIAHSALAHLLVKKLAGVFCARPHTRRVALEHADIIASFISSALACEYLVGNRYYRNLPTILATERYVVGSGENAKTYSAQLTLADVTPEKIQENEEELQVFYDANIDRLESCVEQYERGFVSLKTLRTDPEFVKMFTKFLELNFQTMKWRSLSQDRIAAAAAAAAAAAHVSSSAPRSSDNEYAEGIIACRQIFKIQCRFARLCQYRIAHLFDNSNFSFAGLFRATRSSQLRLCNDGLSSALLTFAAIEPRMVTTEMVPRLGLNYLACGDVSSAANHIQSRDPVFGGLLAKHRHHIPTANQLYPKNQNQILRVSRSVKMTYTPVQDTLDSIRTGQPCCWPEKKDQQSSRGRRIIRKKM